MSNRRPPTLRRPDDFIRAGLADASDRSDLQDLAQHYAAAVPLPLARRMDDHSSTADVLKAQYLPDRREKTVKDIERIDPIGDDAHSPLEGIIHRYPDRVLLMANHSCAVYCRFCFRRAKVGPGAQGLSVKALDAALDYIAGKKQIREVILSGGDPLVMSARRLGSIIGALDALDHIDVIRIHSRIPVAAPDHLDAQRLQVLAQAKKALYVVIHCNHASEIDESAASCFKQLSQAGIPLLGQSVLLKGVNDDEDILAELFRALVRHRIKPYYLHHCDLAPGTGHFQTDIERGRMLMGRLRGRISGLCLPQYVLDIPGGYGKVPLEDSWVRQDGEHYQIRDRHGVIHRYPPEAMYDSAQETGGDSEGDLGQDSGQDSAHDSGESEEDR